MIFNHRERRATILVRTAGRVAPLSAFVLCHLSANKPKKRNKPNKPNKPKQRNKPKSQTRPTRPNQPSKPKKPKKPD